MHVLNDDIHHLFPLTPVSDLLHSRPNTLAYFLLMWHMSPSLKRMNLGKQPTQVLEVTQSPLGKKTAAQAPRSRSRRRTAGSRQACPLACRVPIPGQGPGDPGLRRVPLLILAQETLRRVSRRKGFLRKKRLFQERLTFSNKTAFLLVTFPKAHLCFIFNAFFGQGRDEAFLVVSGDLENQIQTI